VSLPATREGPRPHRKPQQTLILTFLVYADWCGPCKAIAPVYDSLARQLSRPNQITFTKINGDEQKDLAQAYSVRA